MGSTPSTKIPEYYGGDKLWITPSDIVKGKKYVTNTERKLTELGWDKARVIPANSVLITAIASIGKNCIIREDASCNQQIIALTPNNRYDVEFIYYTVCSLEDYLHSIAGKATVEIVNKGQLADVTIKVPNIKEQKQIATLLGTYDSLADSIQKSIDTLEKEKNSIMQKIFA